MRVSRGWLKLRRDIFSSRWQFLAVAAVIAIGVAIFIGAYGSYQNLRSSYDRTYEELRFGDLWVDVADAPASVVDDVRAVEGVSAAEGRLVQEMPIALPDAGPERMLGRFVTLPADRRADVNDVKVTQGSYFSSTAGEPQVLLEDGFADFHGAEPGDTLQVIVDGDRQLEFHVQGVAASPEYLWVARDERELFTEPTSFGVVFASYDELSSLVGQTGRINQLSLRLEDGAEREAVSDRLADVLAPYGLGRTVDRDRQLSNRLLRLDLDGFQNLALVFPILFLSVSALAIYTLLNRLVQTQRPHIGLMRAIGYTRGQVLLHYLVYGLAIGVVAAAIGVGLGYVLAGFMTEVYAHFLSVPFVSRHLQPGLLAIGFGAGVLTSVVAGAVPAWASAGIRPADAMHPPPPTAGRRTLLEIIVPPVAKSPYVLRLPLRNLFRAARRTIYTAFGVGSGVALVIVAASLLDSYDSAVSRQFDDIQKFDVQLTYTQPVPATAAGEVAALDGVERAEPMLEVPVQLSANGESHTTALRGLIADSQMYGTLTPGGDPVAPGDGVLLTSAISDMLDAGQGDTVTVKPLVGQGVPMELTVDHIVQQPVGDVAFAQMDTAQALAGGEGLATSVLASFDGTLSSTLRAQLLDLPGAPTPRYTEDLEDYVAEVNQLFFVFVGIMLGFGVALGFAIIFNTITINTLERRRELATMRTIGAAVGRLGAMLTVENVLMGLLGVVIGLPLGYGLALYFATLYQNELLDMPMVIYTRTYGIAAMGALLVLLLAEWPSLRFVRRLDLPAVVREMSA